MKSFDVRSFLIAIAFAGIGFMIADRMAAAHAAPAVAPMAADGGGAFSGTTGTVTLGGDWVVVVRDNKVYKLNIGRDGDNNRLRPWVLLAE